MANSFGAASPIATLTDGYGVCQIINDDHCYLLCLKQSDGTYKPTPYIFEEAFDVLCKLSPPI